MAETTYQRAISLQPSNWAGYSKLAGFFYVRGDYRQAAEMFRRVTELVPDNARGYANLGAAEQLRGDFPSALASYRKSLSLAPTYLAYSNIGTLEFFSGHPKEAAEAYESAVRLAPDYFQTWANLGDAYRWTPGFETKALEAYTRAIALCENELRVNAQAGPVHSVMAVCLAKTGKLNEAQEHSRIALSIESRDPYVLYHAAVIASIAHKRKESLEWIRLAAGNGYPKLYIERDPEFVGLRSDPAFLEAVRERPGK
jgi:serine/threonine-protein kinase